MAVCLFGWTFVFWNATVLVSSRRVEGVLGTKVGAYLYVVLMIS